MHTHTHTQLATNKTLTICLFVTGCISLRIIFLNFREAVRAAEVKKKCALAVTDVYDI
jgi:hypothetical protein